MTPKTLPTAMEWRDRFSLFCGDVEVARMTGRSRPANMPNVPARWTVWVGVNQRQYTHKDEGTARRAINRKFGLPDMFGQKP